MRVSIDWDPRAGGRATHADGTADGGDGARVHRLPLREIGVRRSGARPALALEPSGPEPGVGVDEARIERAVREILVAIGEDPDREGLLDTPSRVARAYREIFSGMREDAGVHLARQFAQEQAGDDVVILRDIDFVSVCEHHLMPFIGRAHVAYLPAHGRVTGLSKLARTVDVYARRPQLQERLTAQVADALVEHLDPRGVAVMVEAEHSCLKLRGARKTGAEMVTTALRGDFLEDRGLRAEVLGLLGRR
jgi:GTP cyclohydrolase I